MPGDLIDCAVNMEKTPMKREQTSLIAPLEKRALIWLARRMPQRVNWDHLTRLGFAGMFSAGLSYWLARDPRALLRASPVSS